MDLQSCGRLGKGKGGEAVERLMAQTAHDCIGVKSCQVRLRSL